MASMLIAKRTPMMMDYLRGMGLGRSLVAKLRNRPKIAQHSALSHTIAFA